MRAAVALTVTFLAISLTAQQTPSRDRFVPDVPSAERFGRASVRNSTLAAQALDIAPRAAVSIPATTHDYLVISLGESNLAVVGSRNRFDLELGAGEMQVITGRWPHKLMNRSDKPSRIVRVEVMRDVHAEKALCGLAASNCHEVRFGKTAHGDYTQTALFETPTAKLFRTSISANGSLRLHDDSRSHLIVALTKFRAHAASADFSLEPGDVQWIEGALPELSNLGSDEACMLILEIKP